MKTLYRQVILPAVTYAAPVWWSPYADSTLKAKVQSIQRLPLIALTGAYRTTRSAPLQVLARAPPLELELDRLCAEFSIRMAGAHLLRADLLPPGQHTI